MRALDISINMNHQEYILNNRKKCAEIAEGMIDGTVHYLEGSITLSSLRFEIGLSEFDDDFIPFIGIASEIDHLPIGSSRKHWAESALEKHETEIQECIKWAKETSIKECKSIVSRFKI